MKTAGQNIRVDSVLPNSRVSASILEKCELIESTAWSKDFTFEQIKSLAEHMELHQVKSGELIFFEGDTDSYFMLILKGKVDIVKSKSRDMPQRVHTLGAGKTIGEMNLIDGEPRSATAVAASDVLFLVMTADNFADLNKKLPRVGLVLVQKIAKQLSQYLRLTTGQLVDHL